MKKYYLFFFACLCMGNGVASAAEQLVAVAYTNGIEPTEVSINVTENMTIDQLQQEVVNAVIAEVERKLKGATFAHQWKTEKGFTRKIQTTAQWNGLRQEINDARPSTTPKLTVSITAPQS